MLNVNWTSGNLTYAIACAGSMTCDDIGAAIGKSGEAVYMKLKRIGYLGELTLLVRS